MIADVPRKFILLDRGRRHRRRKVIQQTFHLVAMGNAPEKIKAIADDVCGCISEDGIYNYCINHGLIQNAGA